MTATEEHRRKRKQPTKDDTTDGVFHKAVDMVMHSDEEGGSIGSDSDGAVDEFPEIDAQSDTDEEDSDFEDNDEAEEEAEEEEDAESSYEDNHIFPKAKTVISDITGQPKRVYPEIEPEYDSDSSTEDVRTHIVLVYVY